jgi:demethoxyubiquinone hydroxylase (CLK1/Coq7/Cat5 family)
VLQIVGVARLKRSDDAVSWRGASQDIMRVSRDALGCAQAAYAGSTARERFCRTPITIETEQNRHERRHLPKKQKKNHDRRRGVLDV